MKILHAGCTATGTPFNGFQKALIKVSSNYQEINATSTAKDAELLRVNQEQKPDIIFFQYQQADVISPSTFVQLKANNPDAWIVNYTGDVRYPLPNHYVVNGTAIDCTLFCNMTDVHEARRQGIKAEYLQYGIDPEIYAPSATDKTQDIVFFGNNYVNQFPLSIKRSQMVTFLKKEYGSRFSVYGNNWGGIESGNLNGSQHAEAGIYRTAKIGINFSHFDYERYSSDRMFRIMGSGCLCMTHRYAGLHLDFESGENVVAWDTFEHLKFQIDYYLQNEDQRAEIAAAGQKLAHEKYSFDAMIDNLLKLHNDRAR